MGFWAGIASAGAVVVAGCGSGARPTPVQKPPGSSRPDPVATSPAPSSATPSAASGMTLDAVRQRLSAAGYSVQDGQTSGTTASTKALKGAFELDIAIFPTRAKLLSEEAGFAALVRQHPRQVAFKTVGQTLFSSAGASTLPPGEFSKAVQVAEGHR